MRRGLSSIFAVLVAAGLSFGAEPVSEFVRRHWMSPIPAQGPAPAGWSGLESSLAPEACGSCHPVQYDAWRTSLHAASMGPGVAGQLVEMLESDPAAALSCQTCHAPLAEQRPLLGVPGTLTANPAFDPALRPRGVVCAGCHVRAHRRFGPPRRDGSLASAGGAPHGGVTRTRAFLSSEFCAGCHQFAPDGFRVNGKLLADTFEEWKASSFGRRGVHCQDCHMPDRRHLWRGIHDAGTVRAGVTISVSPATVRSRVGQAFTLTLTVRNTGVGHAFPTYVTPRVLLRGELIDAGGDVVPGTRQEIVIAREVALDLSEERFDTRLLPGRAAALTYRGRVERPGLRLRLSVVVEPDAFYTRFFETLLAEGAGRGEPQIREALVATRRSPFTVFVRDVPLG
jgi:hypothetical protein